MKKFLIFSLFALLIQSCITSRINSHKLVDQAGRYNKLLLLITDSEQDFYEWNQENFDYVIYSRFNHLDTDYERKVIGNALQRNIRPTIIVPADKAFTIHSEVSYADFMNTLNYLEYDAVLLVQIKGLWKEQRIREGDSYFVPRSEFHVFLIDKQRFKNQYLAKINVDGGSGWNNFEEIFSRFSRELAKDLSDKGFILRPAVL